ncbi:MAG TPA: DNA mismatch repair endonuclease MutL [Spirochaetota bacterium]|nr:DNA mismatch repair endonuclease MutL [Spirochaetota bacterium]
MNKIVLLPDYLKNMIAAGEVIEGPFSVVKELVENSLDAGAEDIRISVEESGLKKIIVRDNGSGILREDIPLAIREHATSKLQRPEDLSCVKTFGFRGEALSSISSVSDFVLISRSKDEPLGARLELKGGQLSISDYAGDSGTTVIVENLFYNIPARKKFLKNFKTEQRNIRETIQKIALASYNVEFSFDSDSKREFTFKKCNDLSQRLGQIFGQNILNHLYFDELVDLKVKIYGFFSRPDFLRGTRDMQFLYVNGRPIDYKFLSYHIGRAYEGIAIGGKYPVAFVFIDIPPELIDVNVHPAKKEVRLFDWKYIDSLIYSLASKVLDRSHVFSAFDLKDEITNNNPSIDHQEDELFQKNFTSKIEPHNSIYNKAEEKSDRLFETSETFSPQDIGGLSKQPLSDSKRVIGIVFGTYILVEENDNLHFIDFHAAHERMLYNSILKNMEFDTEDLLFPLEIEMTSNDVNFVMQQRNFFCNYGFDIDEFSESSVVVRTIPSFIDSAKIEILIKNMIDNLREENDNIKLKEEIAASLACHCAKRSGDSLNQEDIKALLSKVFSGDLELRCPHGRPFLFTLNKKDFERMFKR